MKSIIFKTIKSNKYFLLFLLIFNLYITSWNYSYLIISEGWFLLPAKLISEGKLPYIDFYSYLPPSITGIRILFIILRLNNF